MGTVDLGVRKSKVQQAEVRFGDIAESLHIVLTAQCPPPPHMADPDICVLLTDFFDILFLF